MKEYLEFLAPRFLIIQFLFKPLLKIVFGVNIYGQDNLLGMDRFVLVANHNSHLDILLLYYILPKRQILKTHPLAAKDYFSKSRILFLIIDYLFKPIWVDRVAKETKPLEKMKARLLTGHNLIIFPEGTRGKPGEIGKFYSGFARLADEFRNIPIIPVFISGPERAFPKKGYLPVPLWNNITIGPPQVFTGTCEEFTESLEKTIRDISESEVVARHKRPALKKKPLFVAVMGIDGSGKSTLSRVISKRLSDKRSVCLITDHMEFYEHGNKNNLQPFFTERIREAIGDYAKQANSLKNYKIPKLAELLLRDYLVGEVERWKQSEFIVQDGSPLLNLVGWAILYKEETFDRIACLKAVNILSGSNSVVEDSDPIFKDFPELMTLKQLRFSGMNLPSVLIMLDVDPAICCNRIISRGQQVQPHETEEKLGKMREGYQLVCDVVSKELSIPLLQITGDRGIEEITESVLDFINQSIV